MLSIESQVKEMLALAEKEKLEIVEVKRESRTLPRRPERGRC